jgi:hypothetical protein
MRIDERVYLVTTREQVGAIAAEFIGQMLRRGALRDAAQDLNDCRTALAGLPPDCASEQIEDCTALPAAVIGNDGAPSAVGRLGLGKQMAVRAVQAIWMQNSQ